MKVEAWPIMVEVPIRCRIYNSWEREWITAPTIWVAKSWYDRNFGCKTDREDWSEANYSELIRVADDKEREEELDKAQICRIQWVSYSFWHNQYLRPLYEHLQRGDLRDIQVAFSTVV